MHGGNEGTKGLFDATKDENTVIFNTKSHPDVDFIQDYIESQQIKSHSNNHSNADELRKLKSLLDDGIINQTDFDNQKKKLLL